jgi:hypothetical protein
MDSRISALLGKLREIEDELESTLEERRAELRYRISGGKVAFEKAVVAEHRRLRTGLLRFLRQSTFGDFVTALVVYVFAVVLVLLDVFLALYQLVCFPIWNIPRVRRADYITIDRHNLAYLNAVQKMNCIYCGYANGLAALLREVASRTEQYWCPIKHAIRVKGAHARYRHFAEFGDARDFQERLKALREELRQSQEK